MSLIYNLETLNVTFCFREKYYKTLQIIVNLTLFTLFINCLHIILFFYAYTLHLMQLLFIFTK